MTGSSLPSDKKSRPIGVSPIKRPFCPLSIRLFVFSKKHLPPENHRNFATKVLGYKTQKVPLVLFFPLELSQGKTTFLHQRKSDLRKNSGNSRSSSDQISIPQYFISVATRQACRSCCRFIYKLPKQFMLSERFVELFDGRANRSSRACKRIYFK